MDNRLKTILISRMHKVCIVFVNAVLTEPIIDTGGAWYLIDLSTARKLNILIQLDTKHRIFGRFQVPNIKFVGMQAEFVGFLDCNLVRD